MTHLTLDDLKALQEGYNVEFKEAVGENGRGALPKNFWETYSAFANSDGGEIYLGVKEQKDKSIKVLGLSDPDQLKQEIFNLANNKEKISHNLLHNHSVICIHVDGKKILKVTVSRAPRTFRPVYVNQNPFKGAYIRRNEGDYLLDESSIKKMLGEQTEASSDAKILKGFTLDDFDQETINIYRHVFAARAPTHPFITQEPKDFLRAIGAWSVDRDTKEAGPTRAGLLMFGKLRSILDEAPNYILDYQERLEEDVESRWIDRITTDGSWSGNIYDFYRRAYQKLVVDLKVPF